MPGEQVTVDDDDERVGPRREQPGRVHEAPRCAKRKHLRRVPQANAPLPTVAKQVLEPLREVGRGQDDLTDIVRSQPTQLVHEERFSGDLQEMLGLVARQGSHPGPQAACKHHSNGCGMRLLLSGWVAALG